jgi:hypothetical protein
MSFRNEIDQKERAEVLKNDLRNNNASTFFDHTHNEVGGRFSAISSPQIVGSTALPKYEGAPNWANDPAGQEPPLGLDNPVADPSCEVALPHQAPPNPERSQASLLPLAARSGLGFFPRTYRRA